LQALSISEDFLKTYPAEHFFQSFFTRI
jgi:hypothetical protein